MNTPASKAGARNGPGESVTPYVGRFAPSPTGPLHAGSLVAALASWLDARAHGGRWLVRIEDADTERCLPGLGEHILAQLAAFGLRPDDTPVWQTQRTALYDAALQRLTDADLAYPCGCTRRQIDEALSAQGVQHARHGERVYPGTCRMGLHGKAARAWRLATWRMPGTVDWQDRRLGAQQQDVAQ
ncbi:MAG: tRNA glutamyl-Q(34) synthetase GluQRS, partial [Comamonadaceae bacterium]